MITIMDSIKIDNYPQRWLDIYNDFTYTGIPDNFTSNEYLHYLNENYGLFDNCIIELQEAAELLNKNHDHLIFSRVFSKAMKHPDFRTEISKLKITSKDHLLHLAFFFAVIPHIEEHYLLLKKREIEENIISDTIKGYEETLSGYISRFDRVGYDLRYINWIMLYLEERILRIGRFNFEMRNKLPDSIYVFENSKNEIKILIDNAVFNSHGMIHGTLGQDDSTEEFNAYFHEYDKYYEGFESDIKTARAITKPVRLMKDEWYLKLCPEDKVLSVHIPSGGKLTGQICENAYLDAARIFKRYYPEFEYKGFFCASWLLDPTFTDVLPDDSGIVSFQKKYLRYPRKSTGRAVLDFVFYNRFNGYDDLPENTSLQRFLKQHYQSGKFIYEPGGVFF